MLLSVLLMSASVQATPITSAAPPLATSGRPAYWKIRSDCAVLAAMSTGVESGENSGRQAGKAPTALRYAVLRQVDGCPVPTPVRRPR
jgi:hypothetical protein